MFGELPPDFAQGDIQRHLRLRLARFHSRDAAPVAVEHRERDDHAEAEDALQVVRFLALHVRCDRDRRPAFVPAEPHSKPLLLQFGDPCADVEVLPPRHLEGAARCPACRRARPCIPRR